MRQFLILALLCLFTSAALAQDDFEDLFVPLDTAATANGLSSGDGIISPSEQTLVNALSQGIADYTQFLDSIAQTSPEATAQITAVNQAMTERDAAYEALSFRDKLVVDTLEHGSQEYDRLVEQERLYDQLSARDKLVIDALDEGDRQYVEWIEEQQLYEELSARDKLVIDVLTQEIAEYAIAHGLDAPNRVGDTLKDAARQAIDNSNIANKGMTKWHIINIINQAVEWEVPSQLLPTNGYWRAHPFNMTITGDCADYVCDGCGGADPGSVEEDPGQPLCGYANTDFGLPFITWQGQSQPYLPGTGSIYSQEPSISTELMNNSSGATLGSYQRTFQTEYRVISPSQIIVTIVITEEGGCSMTGEYLLELVTPDESVCPPMIELTEDLLVTPEPISTPEPAPTSMPEDEQIYQVAAPLFPEENPACTEENSPPQLTEIALTQQEDGSLLLDYGTGTQILYSTGDGLYMFDSGAGGTRRDNVSVFLFGDGTGSLGWSVNDYNGNLCRTDHDIGVPGHEMFNPTPEPTPEAEAPVGGEMQMTAFTPGSYSAEWMEIDGLCPVDLQPLAPTFTEVSITQTDAATITLAFDGQQYVFTDMTGEQFYVLVDHQEGDLLVSASLMSMGDGTAMLSWGGYPNGDTAKLCTAIGELKLAQ